jgi:predicted small secreted protein
MEIQFNQGIKMIKKIMLVAALAASMLTLSGCGNDKTINGTHYDTFGIANESSHRDPKILYEISFGSVLCALFFVETVIVPLYVIGWDLWQPVKVVQPEQK